MRPVNNKLNRVVFLVCFLPWDDSSEIFDDNQLGVENIWNVKPPIISIENGYKSNIVLKTKMLQWIQHRKLEYNI